MDQKYGEFVGVDSVHAAIITEDSEANYVTETPEYFAPAADIAGETENNSKTNYYDNVPAETYVAEGVTTLNITVSGVPAKLAAKYLGKDYDEASGRVYDNGEPDPPNVALSFRFNKGKNHYRYYQYLKGVFTGGTEEASSKKQGDIEVKTYQLTFTAVTTTYKWNVDGKLQGLKRIYADTTEESFNPTGWFNLVQTPNSISSPDALNLISSNPANSDTDVAVNSDIVLTFNNKITDNIITLFTDVFALVDATITIDSTGKIITISPTSDLSASTEYALVITEAKDIYGQSIQNQIIKFTTAA